MTIINCLICWNTTLVQERLYTTKLGQKQTEKQELQITQTEHNDEESNLPVSHKIGAASNTKINKYRVVGK